MEDLRLVSKSKAAEYLGIGKESLTSLLEERRIGFITIKERVKIPIAELRRFVEQSMAKGKDIHVDLSSVKKFNSKSSPLGNEEIPDLLNKIMEDTL